MTIYYFIYYVKGPSLYKSKDFISLALCFYYDKKIIEGLLAPVIK